MSPPNLKRLSIALPDGLNIDTAYLVREFAEALAAKLRADEIKHGFSNEWLTDASQDQFRNDLFMHLLKGDPRDVAVYCAFMWKHGWRTLGASKGQQLEAGAGR